MAEPISIQQLKDASLDVKSLEEVVNGDENVVVTTRLGETYPSVKSVINNIITQSGLIIVDSFELGATLTQRNQALRDASNSRLYRWLGDLPKVVPASSTPESSGGFGTNAWLEVSDISLRQEVNTFKSDILHNSEISSGLDAIIARMVAGEAVSIACYGDSTTDGVGTTGWTANPTSGGKALGTTNHTIVVDKAYPLLLQNILQDMFKNARIKVMNAGYSGQRLDNGWAYNNYDAAIKNNPHYGVPDICFIAFGLNEHNGDPQTVINNHIEQSSLLVEKLLSEGTLPILLSMDASRRADKYKLHSRLDSAKKFVASKYEIPYWDINREIINWLGAKDNPYNWLEAQPDSLHLGDDGHAFKAQYLAYKLNEIGVYTNASNDLIMQAWDERTNLVKPYTTYFAPKSRQGGNSIHGTKFPENTTIAEMWVWNTNTDNELIYRDSTASSARKTNPLATPLVFSIEDYFGNTFTPYILMPCDIKASNAQNLVAVPYFCGRLDYGLSKVRVRSEVTQAKFFGYFEVVNRCGITNTNMLPSYTPYKATTKTANAEVYKFEPSGTLHNTAGTGKTLTVDIDATLPSGAGVVIIHNDAFDGNGIIQENGWFVFHHGSGNRLTFYSYTKDVVSGNVTYSEILNSNSYMPVLGEDNRLNCTFEFTETDEGVSYKRFDVEGLLEFSGTFNKQAVLRGYVGGVYFVGSTDKTVVINKLNVAR